MKADHSLESLLGAARRDVLGDAAVARIHAGLGTAGAGGVVTAKWWTSSIAAKLAATALAGGLVVAGVLATRPHDEHVALVTPVVHVAAAPPIASSSLSEPVVAPAASVIDLAEPVKHVAAPRARAVATTTATAASSAAIPAPPAPAQTSAREGLLLLRARAVLATDPERSLELVREHTAEFPTSQLGPERDKLRRDAEIKLGR